MIELQMSRKVCSQYNYMLGILVLIGLTTMKMEQINIQLTE